jgi:sugar fermentation stimulation protein A
VKPVRVPLPAPLVEGRFLDRPNRFLIRCRIPGHDEDQEVHMADPGRLRELLVPGARLWVHPAASPTRRTRWTAVLVETPGGGGVVGLRTTLPNDLVRRALEEGALPEFEGCALRKAEWTHGRSRFDFLLDGPEGRPLALEVKGVTLVEDGVARFPDAVTARGARHVRELAAMAAEGKRDAAILFVLQRDDAASIEAARTIDPGFAEALDRAREAGVRLLGRRCRVSLEAVELAEPVAVR